MGDLMWHSSYVIISSSQQSHRYLLQSSQVISTKITKAMYFHHVPRCLSQFKDHELSVDILQTHTHQFLLQQSFVTGHSCVKDETHRGTTDTAVCVLYLYLLPCSRAINPCHD